MEARRGAIGEHAPTGPESPARPFRYQPALDGVRGVAIVLVVLFHYPWGVTDARAFFGNNPVHGGFLGVDAFFVLSGFLITTLLLQEHAKSGGVNLRRFYARRAFRLVPALVVLLVIAVFLHFLLPAGDVNRPETSGLLGMLFYVANWVSIYRPKALGITADTWSLAIEEQFYLLWPIVLVLMLRRRLRTATIAVVTTVGVAPGTGITGSARLPPTPSPRSFAASTASPCGTASTSVRTPARAHC
jgi:peptidoglycan/LPS O-acetylase OafA/YrhL